VFQAPLTARNALSFGSLLPFFKPLDKGKIVAGEEY
jgi:hypothetical protein